tara:strand:- start:79 stop:405 length:327 start_codon:yes stop_codon:yes gene_type:complete
MNFYGFSDKAVANVLSIEIFTCVICATIVGILPGKSKNYTCMAFLGCIMCCLSLPLIGLNNIFEIQREGVIPYIAAGVAISGIAQGLVVKDLTYTMLPYAQGMGLITG